MNRHDNFPNRLRVLKALLQYPEIWKDTVDVAQRTGMQVRSARIELRALRREGELLRCGRGRWKLRDAGWALTAVLEADRTAEFHRQRLAQKAESIRLGTVVLGLPQIKPCVETTWDELMAKGLGVFKK